MNSAVRRFTLFFFSLAALASCEDPSDIGLDLQDENLIGTQYTELAIEAGTVLQPDSILAFNQSRAVLGGYQDATLGNVKATVFTELSLSGTDLNFGENPVLDSVTLTLDYDVIYGAAGHELSFNIHRLSQGFNEKASYFTNSSLPYESEILGDTTFKPELITEKDSVTKQEKQFYRVPTIHLERAFGQELLNQSGKTPLKTQPNFVQYLKGLAIVPTEESPRVMIGLNLGSNTKMVLYYKNGTDTTRKSHTFLFSGMGARDFSRITANRSGTALANLQKGELLPAEQVGGETYLQSSTALLTKLTIPFLEELKEEHGNIVINRAELVLPVKNGTEVTIKPPSKLAMYIANGNRIKETSGGEAITVPKDLTYAINSNGYPAELTYNSKKNEYSANITAYIQAVLLGQKPNASILVGPARFSSTSSAGTTMASKEIIPYRAILSNTAERGMKLRVYFTKLD
ncbi:DUF4270 domain-containing protein [Pontibacter sp. Tf4]|uniref:DUF4270 family protein n=1 Tax=Pontibacter sp. Tf4 TaxID=2761620 RepID=UPI0016244F68|nr:DUF4270 family protein [Pontibacter sp. Tf4]MBB6609521.1 DUF4270 domain-containing protein [Pontibacter sp. Tf4]